MSSADNAALVPAKSRVTPLYHLARSRVALLAVAQFYAFTIHFAHFNFLNPVWGYYGFIYNEPSTLDMVAMVGLVAIGSLFLPTVLSRPSSIVLLLLFIVVYVPTIAITLSLTVDSLARYGPVLAVLAFGFATACIVARARLPAAAMAGNVPGEGFTWLVFAAWAICGAILVVVYRSVMSFAGLSEIYDQRAVGASANLFLGYVHTYFSNVFSPALIALGLVRSRRYWAVIGAGGCLLSYMIDAQRTVIMLPIAILGIFFLLRSRVALFRSTVFMVSILAVAVLISATYYDEGVIGSFFAFLLVFRTLSVPGVSFSQYFDLFSREGFTWWSHVKGFSLLVPTPDAFVGDPNWPSLGFVVGDRVYGSTTLDANASLFAGDGAAAAGAFGVAVISLALALWLRWLDRASIGWHRTFVVLVLVPVALSLTNGHLFTTLLSFGGLFWISTFLLYKPGRRHRPRD